MPITTRVGSTVDLLVAHESVIRHTDGQTELSGKGNFVFSSQLEIIARNDCAEAAEFMWQLTQTVRTIRIARRSAVR